MNTITITAREIFAANQVLTLVKANELIGRTIACTAPEYHMNQPHVTIMKISRIVSEWDLVAEQSCEGYANRQDYWASYMSPEQIDERKTRLTLLGDNNEGHYIAHTKYYNFYNEPTFTGSDADRGVYYILLD